MVLFYGKGRLMKQLAGVYHVLFAALVSGFILWLIFFLTPTSVSPENPCSQPWHIGLPLTFYSHVSTPEPSGTRISCVDSVNISVIGLLADFAFWFVITLLVIFLLSSRKKQTVVEMVGNDPSTIERSIPALCLLRVRLIQGI